MNEDKIVLRLVEWSGNAVDNDGWKRQTPVLCCPLCCGLKDLTAPNDGHKDNCRLHVAVNS